MTAFAAVDRGGQPAATSTTPRSSNSARGHGALSRRLLDAHPTAELTITDLDETSVAKTLAALIGAAALLQPGALAEPLSGQTVTEAPRFSSITRSAMPRRLISVRKSDSGEANTP